MMAVKVPDLAAAVPFYGGQPAEDEVVADRRLDAELGPEAVVAFDRHRHLEEGLVEVDFGQARRVPPEATDLEVLVAAEARPLLGYAVRGLVLATVRDPGPVGVAFPAARGVLDLVEAARLGCVGAGVVEERDRLAHPRAGADPERFGAGHAAIPIDGDHPDEVRLVRCEVANGGRQHRVAVVRARERGAEQLRVLARGDDVAALGIPEIDLAAGHVDLVGEQLGDVRRVPGHPDLVRGDPLGAEVLDGDPARLGVAGAGAGRGHALLGHAGPAARARTAEPVDRR